MLKVTFSARWLNPENEVNLFGYLAIASAMASLGAFVGATDQYTGVTDHYGAALGYALLVAAAIFVFLSLLF